MPGADWRWLAAPGLAQLPEFLIALAIGLLMGLERERAPTAKAGLRTFALVALLGAASAVLAGHYGAPALVAIGAATVAATMIAAYLRDPQPPEDPGTTTVVAAVLCFALGAMATSGYAQLAVMLAIAATVLLAFKAELRGVAQRLERRDLASVLQFAVVAFIVLPLLPDAPYGPYDALNPRQVWGMVVLVSGVSLAGYVALRLSAGGAGVVVVGALGGLVSSTATTLSYARRAAADARLTGLAAAAIVIANTAVPLRLALLAAVAAPAQLAALAPLLAGAFLPGAFAAAAVLRGTGGAPPSVPVVRNPTELRTALAFGALYAAVLLAVAWLNAVAGSRGVYAAAALAGLTDVDAIALSSLRLAALGTLAADAAALAVAAALAANVCFKLGVALLAGGRALARRCAGPFVAVLAGLAAAALLAR